MHPGPFTRWPRAADAVLAVALFVLTVSIEEGPGDSLQLRDVGDVPLLIVLLFAVASGALFWRRRAPVVVLAVVLAAWALTLDSGFADLGGQSLIAVYGLGRHGNAERWGHVGVDAAIVVLVLDGVTADLPWGEVAFGVVVFFAAWYAGCGCAPSATSGSSARSGRRRTASSPRSGRGSRASCTTSSRTGSA